MYNFPYRVKALSIYIFYKKKRFLEAFPVQGILTFRPNPMSNSSSDSSTKLAENNSI